MLLAGQVLEVLLGGLLSGVLYSLVALGFVLIFKASGVFNFAQGALFNGEMAAKDWAHIATASGIWLVIPLAVGLTLLMRSEVK